MIRVTHVITRMVRGGAQQIVLELARRMDRSKFDVQVLCGEQDSTMIRDFEDVVPVTRVPSLVREVSPRQDAKALYSLFRTFGRRPHVVHGHTYKAGVLSSIAARKAGVPAVVFTPHGHIFNPKSKIPGVPLDRRIGILKAVTKYAQACAHRVTALSREDLNEQLSHQLSPPGKYVVIRNGIDISRYHNEGRTPGRTLVLGSVGRLTTEKGHRYLVPVLREIPGARLVIVGDGPERDAIQTEARLLGVERRIDLVGERESADILPTFDIYLQPSLYESQGLAILEAMAAGVPVVATNVGGVAGVVRHQKTGLLVPPADPSAMAQAIRKLRGDAPFARDLVGAAKAMVASDFSVDRMVEDYERLYLQLLGR